jgi:multidrug efflux pump subunit AcrA (membrane-fusion protein)
MKKKIAIFAATGLLAAALIVFPSMLARGEEAEEAKNALDEPVYAVNVSSAQKQTLQAYIQINGNIVTEQQVVVVPDTAGKLTAVYIDLGSRIQKGAVLAQVDSSRPGASYMPSPVYAPISGTVTSIPLAVGSTVSNAMTIAVISQTDTLEIETMIPEREVGQLREGLIAEVRLQAYPGEVFTAKIIRVSPVVDPASRTKKIVLHFDHPDSRINPGMFARIKLNTRIYQDVIAIPTDAIVQNLGLDFVFVYDGNTSGRVQRREVKTGASVDGLIEIKSGIDEGDRVIIQGQQFLTDGAVVRVIG